VFGPILRGERVVLEPARTEDAAEHCRWAADLELSRLLTNAEIPTHRQQEEWLERVAKDDGIVLWRITAEERLVGTALLTDIEWRNRQAKQAMLIADTADRGKGYGSEAVQLRTRYAFEDLGLERLESSTLSINVGMQRALERSGFRQIGLRRHRAFFGGQWHDENIFELVYADWQAFVASPR
jgi:RimJ/RimL family protein N-acetyltransferase